MADNFQVTQGSGITIAADDIGGVHHQRVKLVIGANGTNDGDVASGNPMPVSGAVTISGTPTISGTVTANAGTNLNTSALALESGGNLAAAATSLAIIDDWDESDRCKVNVIVGQAGVQGASGGVSATTLRVTLATDVALPAGTNAIGKLAANSGVDIGDVDVTSCALPTGASTLAEQQTQTTHLSGAATSLAILDDWDESDRCKVNPISGQAGVQGGSGSVSNTTQRVVLATDVALPAGTNAIGKLAANSGVDIGDVDVTSCALPTGASTLAEQQTQTTSLQLIDDVIGSGDAAITKYAVIGAIYDDASTGTVTENQAHSLRMTSRRALIVEGLAANPVPVTFPSTPSVNANAGTNLNTSALALESGGNLAGAATSLAIIDDWDESDRCKVNPIVGQAGVQGASGAVSNTTQRVVLATDVGLPAGTALLGKVSASHESGTIYDGTTAMTPKFAIIDAASSGDNTILAAVNPKKIRVLSLFIVASAAVTVRFESGASGTALTGQMQLAANSGFVLPYNPHGWFETASNTLLNLELSGAISVDGSFQYCEVA